jgi:hypothetical protein
VATAGIDLLGGSNVGFQVGLIENAAYNDRVPFIARLIELSPALRVSRPPSSALEFALEYGNAHLIPPIDSDLAAARRSPSRCWRRGLRASQGLV